MTLDVSASGYVAKRIALNASDTNTLAMRIQLTPGGSVSGRVIDQNGKPLTGINVYIEGEMEFSTRTDEEGFYEILNVDPTKPLQMYISDFKTSLYERKTFNFPAGSTEATGDFVVNLSDKGLRDITGTVTGVNGEPVAGAEVRFGQGTYVSNSIIQGVGMLLRILELALAVKELKRILVR